MTSRKLPSVWFNSLDPKDRETLEAQLKYSVLKEQFLKILEQFSRELPQTKPDYDNPSWAYRQAHINGLTEAYNKIRKLFDQGE